MRRPLLNICLIIIAFLFIYMGCSDVNPVASTDSVPAIKSVIPAKAPYGAVVRIGVTGFGEELAAQEVYFNNTLAQIEALSDTSIQTKVPLEATTGPVMVITNSGDTLSGPSFTVDSTKNLFFNIDSIDPTKGRAGDEVQIVGNGFSPNPEMNTVLFNDVETPVTSASDTMLATTVSPEVETGPVSVIVNQDTAVGPVFTVEKLRITGISPESGPVGTAVTISGSGFSSTISENTITFAGVEAPIETASETELVGIVPDGAETGPVAVTVGGTTVQGPDFTVETTQNPKSLQVITETTNPPSGFDGYRLSVTGRDIVFINPNGEKTFSDILSDQVDVELTSIPETCTVSGQNPRTVTLDNQSNTTAFSIECALPAPQISSLTPQSGSVGTQVTIAGENFSATASENIITFNGTEAPVNSASTTELVTQVPEGATDGPVEVTVDGKTGTGPDFDVTTTGSLDVVIATQGEDQDSNGYLVSIDGAEGIRTSINETYNQTGLEEGTHQVGISDIADNCFITQDRPNPYDVSITAGQTTTTNVDVQCEAKNEPTIDSISPTSGTTSTQVTISGSNFSSTVSDNVVTFNGVRAELNSATTTELVAFVPFDATTGPVEVTVNGQTATGPTFTVITTGRLEVNISTTGSSIDPNGYGLTLDGGTASAVNVNDFVAYDSLSEGSHSIELSDIASNCFITQDRANPYDVNVTAGDTTITNIDVQCDEPNEPPTASFNFSCENLSCDFDASASSDPDGFISVYNWDYGDGTSSTESGSATNHNYEIPGTYTVELTVGDNEGAEDTITKDVTVTLPQINSITPAEGPIGTEVTITGSGFSATATDNEVEFTSGSVEVQATIKSASETQLVVDVPGDATTGPVYVSTYGYRVQGPTFTVQQPKFLEVSIITSGSNIDPDGYTLSVEGVDDRFVKANDNVTYNDLYADEVRVQLSGIASNCTVGGENPRIVNLNNADNAGFTEFDISCESPLQGKIYFSGRSDSREIFSINPDGTNELIITKNSLSEFYPVVSNDGSKIAFASFDGAGDRQLFVMNADGTGVEQLTNSGGYAVPGGWSPDDSQIVFEYYESDCTECGRSEIYTINADGSNLTRLTTSTGSSVQATAPDWSPDGERIVYANRFDAQGYDIMVMNSDGTNIQRLTETSSSEFNPRWSPDGTQIAYDSNEIFIMNADGSNKIKLTDVNPTANDGINYCESPSWSPSGNHLVYECDDFGIYRTPIDESNNMIKVADGDHPDWVTE